MRPELDVLIVGGAILLTWLIGQVVAWSRADRHSREEVGRFIGKRLVRQWPLLVVLLAPLAVDYVDIQHARWLLIAIGAIVVWWLAEALGAAGRPPARVGDPLRCAVAAARKVWRNRWLVAVLVGLWLLAAAGYSFERMIYMQNHPDARAPVSQQSWATEVRSHLRADYLTVMIVAEAPDSFPSAYEVLSRAWLYVLIALTVGFGYLRFSTALPADRRRRMAWPFRLTILYLLVVLQMHAEWFIRLDYSAFGSDSLVGWITGIVAAFVFVWSAPVHSAIWQMMLQVVRGDDWNPREALVAASEVWPRFVPLLLVLYLPSLLALPPFFPAEYASDALEVYRGVLSNLATIAGMALIMVPWIVLDRRSGFRAATRRAWKLAVSKPSDVMAFVLRYAVAMALIKVAIGVLLPMQRLFDPLHFVQFQALGALELLGVLAVGGLYLRLREEAGASVALEGDEAEEDSGEAVD